MDIMIEPVTNTEGEAAMLRIRRQVFEREMGIALARLTASDDSTSLHLLARAPDGDAVAALSVVETSGNHDLHAGCGLEFPSLARVARYTQLAVLTPYRGMNIPLKLMLEAHHRFVVPEQFDYTWLLFDADRADSSLMCRWLAFVAHKETVESEYGRSRVLVRDERAAAAERTIRRAQQYVEQMGRGFSPVQQTLARPVSGV